MPLSLGTRLGPYEILAPLGAGGMGEVYRARDTRLARDVAVKVLPATFAADPERMARFQREAQVLASLNHPNIAAIYGLEESGGVRALVMELVEGPTLADRIAVGTIPVDEALPIARQMAEALEAAHEKGIIHRDLKPANVKVTPDGKVKVLDFGLAKALADDPASPVLSHSPTLGLAATRAGVILGTAAYMSPEQARGKAVDKRADIWAFGCVLYEMLTGKPAFPGETVSDRIAATLGGEPDWAALPPGCPVELLRRCLQKDPKLRLRDIGDSFNSGETPAAPAQGIPQPALRHRQSLLPWGVAAMAILAAVLLVRLARVEAPARRVQRLAVSLAPADGLDGQFALSPDGTSLVFAGRVGEKRQLFLRFFDRPVAIPLAGTENGAGPFFSPDGQWVGFEADDRLKKMPLSGGPATVICEALGYGASWGRDGYIYLPRGLGGSAHLARVSAPGGEQQPVAVKTATNTGAADGFPFLFWPQILPGGRAALATVDSTFGAGFADASLVAHLLETGEQRTLVQGGIYARYSPTGHLVFGRSQNLLAVPFDLGSLAVTGAPVTVVEDVSMRLVDGVAYFDLSADGTLVYRSGILGEALDTLVWVSRDGKATSIPTPSHNYWDLRISPDGQRLAVQTRDPSSDIWVYGKSRGTLTRMTFDPGEDETPVWSPDGKWLAFTSSRAGQPRAIFRKAADGSGQEELLWKSDHHIHLTDWSRDGRSIAFMDRDPKTQDDIWVLDLAGKPSARPLLQSRFRESQGRLSPDGRWLAYTSNESGSDEIYVQAFPDLNGKWQVSTGGGRQPVWSANGRELFYRGGGQVMAVSVAEGSSFAAGSPRAVSPDRFKQPLDADHVWYDVAPDGKQFVMVQSTERAQSLSTHLNVVLNWFEELQRLVPAPKRKAK